MNNSQIRFLSRLRGVLAIIECNAKEHRKIWEEEKKRCERENEEFVMNRFLLGRSTLIGNIAQKTGIYLKENFEGLGFGKNGVLLKKIIEDVYTTIDKENAKNKNCAVCDIDKMKKEEHLPVGFIDSWVCTWFAYKYMINELKKTIERYNIDLSAMDIAINQYNKFFMKEILVLDEEEI